MTPPTPPTLSLSEALECFLSECQTAADVYKKYGVEPATSLLPALARADDLRMAIRAIEIVGQTDASISCLDNGAEFEWTIDNGDGLFVQAPTLAEAVRLANVEVLS